jgi:hypothetical protein
VNETLVPWLLLLHMFQIVYDRFSHLSIGFILKLVCKFLLIKKMEKSINIQSKRHAFYFYIYSYFLNFFWLLLPFYEPSSLFDCFFANLFLLILIFNKFFSSMSFPSSCTVLDIVENLFLNSSFKGWHKLLLSISTLFEFSIIYVWYWLRMLLKDTFRFLYDSNWP